MTAQPVRVSLSACGPRSVMVLLHYILAALSVNCDTSCHWFIFTSLLAAVHCSRHAFEIIATYLRIHAREKGKKITIPGDTTLS